MDIKVFKVEKWMNENEVGAVYNLGETCIDSLTIRELLELSGENPEEYLAGLTDLRLSYGDIEGSDKLRKGVADLYTSVLPEEVIISHGAIGANYQTLMSLVEPNDNMVSVLPTYQQHYSIPESIGAEVRYLPLTPENKFLPNLDDLRNIVDENTKLITINNPNNPSGSVIPDDMLKEIVEIAKSVDAYLLSDEVYRGITDDGSYMTSVVDLYDKAISVGSMSKIFSLAGLRIGWIVTKNEELRESCLKRRDYDTISCGRLDDLFAAMALENKEKLFERNRKILRENRAILDEWVNNTPGVKYVKPEGGTTALVYYDKDIPSYDLCKKLINEKGVLMTPGYCFELEGCVRVGYAYDSKKLKQGLEIFEEYLKTL